MKEQEIKEKIEKFKNNPHGIIMIPVEFLEERMPKFTLRTSCYAVARCCEELAKQEKNIDVSETKSIEEEYTQKLIEEIDFFIKEIKKRLKEAKF